MLHLHTSIVVASMQDGRKGSGCMKATLMELLTDMVESINWGTMAGGAVGLVIGVFGGWNKLLTLFVFAMVIDYIVGLISAGLGHSTKSANGGIDSRIGFRGILKKCLMFIMVGVGAMVDRLVGTNAVREATTMFFIVNELISITENIGHCGIKLPPALVKMLDQLQDKEENIEE